MNKITSTLAGFAILAAASVAPAMAQGNLFIPPGTFTILPTAAGLFSATGSGNFNPTGSAATTTATFTLTGTQISGPLFQVTALTITPAAGSGVLPFTETGTAGTGATLGAGGAAFDFTDVPVGPGGVAVASVGAAADGTTFNLVNPVPEASTVVSFGALLALGGLAVLRRKSVKNVG